MKHFIVLLAMVPAFLIHSCKSGEIKKPEEHPKEYIGKWMIVKKVYSNGAEEVYSAGDDVYYLNENGKLKRDYRDHRREIRDQTGEWKIIALGGHNSNPDTLYFVKRTPMFNGTFEERFRILSKTDKEMIWEESSWGFEKDNSRDKYHLSRAE
jgi:hypothetical protein